MTKMFGLLKELTTSRAPKKVLIREEAKFPVTKNVNSISLTIGDEEMSKKTNATIDDDIEKPTKTETKIPVKEAEKEDEDESEPNRIARKEEATKAPSSQLIEYYLKHKINEKLIEILVDNHRYKGLKTKQKRYEVRGVCQYKVRVRESVPIMGNNEAVSRRQKDQNTLRLCIMSGG
ncbi:hypothetical protein Tco_1501168 [Tanacetum coccineum]